MNIGEERSSSYPLPSSVISRVPRFWPVRSLWPSTCDRAQRSRSASSTRPISRLTNSTGILRVTAAWSQMFSAMAVLPMLGRAARMMSCSGWNPPVMSSRSK